MSIDIKTIQEAMMSKLATHVPVSDGWTLHVLRLLDTGLPLDQAVEATVEHMQEVKGWPTEDRFTEPEGRSSLIDSYLAELEEEYQTTDNEDLWGGDAWETIRNERVEELVEAYEVNMHDAPDDELFGDDGLKELADAKIEELIDAERDRLDEMDDDELSEYLGSGVNTKNARTQANHVRTQKETAQINAVFRKEKTGLPCQKAEK